MEIYIDFLKIKRNGPLLETQGFILHKEGSLFHNYGNNRSQYENNVFGIGLSTIFKKTLFVSAKMLSMYTKIQVQRELTLLKYLQRMKEVL